MNDELKKELKGTFLEKINKNRLTERPPLKYYDTLPDQVFTKIAENERGNNNIILMRWLSVAASFAIIFGFLIWSNDQTAIENSITQFDSSSSEDIMEYVYEDIEVSEIEGLGLGSFDIENTMSDLSQDEINVYLDKDLSLNELLELL